LVEMQEREKILSGKKEKSEPHGAHSLGVS
jgi:hypothetical protein